VTGLASPHTQCAIFDIHQKPTRNSEENPEGAHVRAERRHKGKTWRWFDNAIKMDASRERDRDRKAYTTYLELAPASPGAGYARQQLEKL
jgi:hypothetical protein